MNKKCVSFMAILLALAGMAQASENDCIKFTGDGAKATFLELYPHTQNAASVIAAGESRMGDTYIKTDNIFCRAFVAGLPKTLSGETKIIQEAMKTLKKTNARLFQCGYFVESNGYLSPCSDL